MRVRTPARLMAFALVVGAAPILLSACDGLSPEVIQQRESMRREARLKELVGRTRDEVRNVMGLPDRTREDHVQQCWGPQEGLWSVLEEGSPYEEWLWIDQKWVMYAWLADPEGKQPDQSAWRVVLTAVSRTDVVY